MRLIIDRFEENFAVVELENGDTALIERKILPNASEGDVLTLEIDADSTEKREKEVKTLFDKLLRK